MHVARTVALGYEVGHLDRHGRQGFELEYHLFPDSSTLGLSVLEAARRDHFPSCLPDQRFKLHQSLAAASEMLVFPTYLGFVSAQALGS